MKGNKGMNTKTTLAVNVGMQQRTGILQTGA